MFRFVQFLYLKASIALVICLSPIGIYGQTTTCSTSANCSSCVSGLTNKTCSCPLIEQAGLSTTQCCCNRLPNGDCTSGSCGGCCQRFRIDTQGNAPAFGQICRSFYCVGPPPACANTFNCLGPASTSSQARSSLSSNIPTTEAELSGSGQIAASPNPIEVRLFSDPAIPIRLSDAMVRVSGNRLESFQLQLAFDAKDPVNAMIVIAKVILKDKQTDVIAFNLDTLVGRADLKEVFQLGPDFKVAQTYPAEIARVEVSLTFAETRNGVSFGANSSEISKGLAARRRPELDHLLQAKRLVDQLDSSEADRKEFQDFLSDLYAKENCSQVIDLLTSIFESGGIRSVQKLLNEYATILIR